MAETVEHRSTKTGLPPGSLVHVGERKSEEVFLSLLTFDKDTYRFSEIDSLKPFEESLSKEVNKWLDISGLHDIEIVKELGEQLDIHPLVLEDIVNTHQRPKAELFENQAFIVVKMLRYLSPDEGVDTEQVSLVFGPGYVVTFQERPGDVLDAVRDRLKKARGRIRGAGSDYLTYALLDVIVDNYFHVLEGISEEIETLEEEILENPSKWTIAKIHRLRREAIEVRRASWPLREIAQKFIRDESDLLEPDTEPFFTDLYDHIVQVIDTVEMQRETLSGFIDLYMSMVSNRMNQIMKVLTVMASIFIPLTFIAGIYGMNFEFMPELKWKWGYFAVWGVMLFLAGGMVSIFRRKDWF